MAATGPQIVGTGANDSSVGGATASWANVSNITASDTTYANASPGSMAGAGGPATQYAVGTMSGNQFTIASDQIIDGIVVEWFVRNNSGTTVDNAVRIVKGGTIGATDKASGTSWPGTLGGRTYGGVTDLWGETWLYSDINAANFGAAISAVNSGGDSQCDIDYCQITVYHHTSSGSSPHITCGVTYLLSGQQFGASGSLINMKKNVAGQKIGCQMITIADGSEFTGSVDVYVTGDAGTQAIGSVGSGACTHEGHGYHTYAPAQAETNYDLIGFTFVATGAITITIQVATSTDAVVTGIEASGLADMFTVDSGTTFGSAVAGSVVKEIADNAASAGLNLTSINGTSIAGTGTQVADAFVTLFNVASPVLTAASVNQTGDSYAIVNSGTFGNSALKTLIDTVDTVVDGIATSSTTIEGKIDVIDGNVDSILVDTAEIGAAGAGLTALATQASVDVIDGNVDSILVDTAEIGAAGAGLTALSTQASVDAIQADTNDIQTRIPAALVSGRMDSSVGAMATNTLTAAALATDAVTEIQSGLATTADVTAGAVVCCKLGFAFTSSAGTEARFIAWLESNGQFVVLPSGTCDIDIREEGSGTDLFTVTAAAPEADGTFYLEKTTPGFTADRVYKATVTIVDDAAATWVSVVDLPVWA